MCKWLPPKKWHPRKQSFACKWHPPFCFAFASCSLFPSENARSNARFALNKTLRSRVFLTKICQVLKKIDDKKEIERREKDG